MLIKLVTGPTAWATSEEHSLYDQLLDEYDDEIGLIGIAPDPQTGVPAAAAAAAGGGVVSEAVLSERMKLARINPLLVGRCVGDSEGVIDAAVMSHMNAWPSLPAFTPNEIFEKGGWGTQALWERFRAKVGTPWFWIDRMAWAATKCAMIRVVQGALSVPARAALYEKIGKSGSFTYKGKADLVEEILHLFIIEDYLNPHYPVLLIARDVLKKLQKLPEPRSLDTSYSDLPE